MAIQQNGFSSPALLEDRMRTRLGIHPRKAPVGGATGHSHRPTNYALLPVERGRQVTNYREVAEAAHRALEEERDARRKAEIATERTIALLQETRTRLGHAELALREEREARLRSQAPPPPDPLLQQEVDELRAHLRDADRARKEAIKARDEAHQALARALARQQSPEPVAPPQPTPAPTLPPEPPPEKPSRPNIVGRLAADGSNLRELRLIAGLTGAELARRSGVSHSQISQLENGVTRRLQEKTVAALERGLGIERQAPRLAKAQLKFAQLDPEGRNLRELRIAAGLHCAELARRSGVSTATISKIEDGDYRRLRQKTLDGLAHGLGVGSAAPVPKPTPEPQPVKWWLPKDAPGTWR